ncbi:MAG: hypothetical protein EBS68_17250 [Rhodobacteraceae bacterium]|nr:hypothetical protein [Paracoccaceae bacterium]
MDSEKVTEADREAVESARAWCDDMDEPEMVQAFARHRLASTEALREENERLREALRRLSGGRASVTECYRIARKALDTEGAANEQAG